MFRFVKNLVLLLLFNYSPLETLSQCTCYLDVSATKKNAIINCSYGSITVLINGDICNSLTHGTVTLSDSSNQSIIDEQSFEQLPAFIHFANIPASSYKIKASHPCSTPDSMFINLPAVASDPDFIHSTSDVYVHGCNDGTIGLEITGDYCSSTLNIKCEDTLLHSPVTFQQTPYCSFCYLADNLHAGVYKIDVYDTINAIHHIHYATINEPACNFYISANQGRLEACTNEKMDVHLLGDYCLSNTFSIRLYNSAMVRKDSIINATLNDTLVHFYNTKPGTYTVTSTYANSCTSTTTAIIKKYCPIPTNLSDSIVDTNSRSLHWEGYPCLAGYELSYKRKGTTSWQTIILNGSGNNNAIIGGLLTGSTYQWRVRSLCGGTKKSLNSPIKTFVVSIPNRTLSIINDQQIKVYPNPAIGIVNVSFISGSMDNMTESIYNDLGELIYYRSKCLPLESYNLSYFPSGIYLLKIENGESVYTEKIMH